MDSKKLAVFLVLSVLVVLIEESEAIATGMAKGTIGGKRELFKKVRVSSSSNRGCTESF
jgi:hypothetical protein